MLIKDIDQLKKYVKINANLPFDTVSPFLAAAEQLVLDVYIGEPLMLRLQDEGNLSFREKKLAKMLCMAQAPLALKIGISELSVRMSDAGFTVEKNNDYFVPASDSKIQALREELEKRGMQHLDKALCYIEKNPDDFALWSESTYFKRRHLSFLRDARQFQNIGMVNIEYDRFVFDELQPTILMIEERFISDLFPADIFRKLKVDADTTTDEHRQTLVRYIRRFLATKTAELYTAEDSKNQRQKPNKIEYVARVRPLFYHLNERNFYADQAAYYLEKIESYLNDHADKFGIAVIDYDLRWNAIDKNMFVDIG